MWKVSFRKHTLQFRFEAGTSRGVLREKDTWFLFLWDEQDPDKVGIGECGPLKGLSIDDREDFSSFLYKITAEYNSQGTLPLLSSFPSIRFGWETAQKDLQNGGIKKVFSNRFYSEQAPIPINGLIWMGKKEFMVQQIKEKIAIGFSCIKLKIGALDFATELEVLTWIRQEFSEKDIVLRLDANGAFHPTQALKKLYELAPFGIHSIEQPIKAGQVNEMSALCSKSPIPIALDEELIGIKSYPEKEKLIKYILPPYIILKPTLLGGFKETDEWIQLAEENGVDWWITSALESNIGLNAICQYTFEMMKNKTPFPQGLGTGGLYLNNIESPLIVSKGTILYEAAGSWDVLPRN